MCGGRWGRGGVVNAVKSGGTLCVERSYLAVGGHTCFEITGSSQRCWPGQCGGGRGQVQRADSWPPSILLTPFGLF